MPELTAEIKEVQEGTETERVMEVLRTNADLEVTEEQLRHIAALKVAMQNLAEKYGCTAVAIQCWNALLTEEGIPVACETDIHGRSL